MSAAALQYKSFLRGEIIVDDKYDLKKWRIPDQIVRFISNIPRALQSKRLHDTKWVMRHVWNFFEFKFETDVDDITNGQPLHLFADFIIDTMLQRCERRVDAESYLFILLKSLQNCLAKKKTPMLHSFARFLGVFGITDDENYQSELGVEASESANVTNKSKHNDSTIHKKSFIGKNTVNVHRGSKITVDNMKVSSSNLSRGILDVYLFSRLIILLN
jgi:hypothetical protein